MVPSVLPEDFADHGINYLDRNGVLSLKYDRNLFCRKNEIVVHHLGWIRRLQEGCENKNNKVKRKITNIKCEVSKC